MLINPGDLIPVRAEAIHIPWTKRKSTILNFLHRGPVTFKVIKQPTFHYKKLIGEIKRFLFSPTSYFLIPKNRRFFLYKKNFISSIFPNCFFRRLSTIRMWVIFPHWQRTSIRSVGPIKI